MHPLRIAGRPVSTSSSTTLRLPYDGTPIADISLAGPAELELALSAATAAAPAMAELTRDERAALLRRAHDALRAQADDFALTIASESGKPLREARAEVDRAAYTLLFSSEEAHRLAGEVVPMDASPAGKHRWGMTIREPVGVIAAITPFNFPLNLSLHKIGPALAAGNTVIHKPASTTPLTALKLAELFDSCGLPPGALNVIVGPGSTLGDALVTDPRVAMVTCTGSAPVGTALRARAGLKRVTLELGNNSALVVDETADLADVVPRAVTGSFANSGQVCISIQRIYAHRGIRDEFLDRLTAETPKLVHGDPRDPATDVSSLITESEAQRVDDWITEAEHAGARRLTGSPRDRARLAPTILSDLPTSTRLYRQEAFGPVVAVNAFSSLDEAVEAVNDSDYGLQAGIYTRDLARAFSAARRIRCGAVHINEVPQYRLDQMPYGGMKQSGIGREGPHYAIEEMTELKLVTWPV